MPYTWTPPQLFMRYKGVNIYHAYKDGPDPVQLCYHYTTSGYDEIEYEFDVRDLPEVTGLNTNNSDNHPRIIQNAIETNALNLPEGVEMNDADEIVTEINDSPLAMCDICSHVFKYTREDLSNIPNLLSRIEAGQTVPAAECPKCGCLAYGC